MTTQKMMELMWQVANDNSTHTNVYKYPNGIEFNYTCSVPSKTETCTCDCDCEDCEDEDDKYMTLVPEVRNVIFSDPVTIMFFEDGTKTTCRATKNDKFDKSMGIITCLAKRAYGDIAIDDDGKVVETGIGFTSLISKLVEGATDSKAKAEDKEAKKTAKKTTKTTSKKTSKTK